jgi:hypothetical protein
VINTDVALEMFALIDSLSRGPRIARQARMALLDHDVEMVRNLLRQIEQLGSSDQEVKVK